MIKTSAMFSAHALHALLRNTLIILVTLFIALFFWLKVGIEADKLVLGDYKIEKLYLKLDKKLTLKADKVLIPQKKEKASFTKIDKVFDKVKYLFTFFERIDLKHIDFDNNHYAFVFQDNILDISNDDYSLKGTIERKGLVLTANVSQFRLKKEAISLYGSVSYTLRKHKLSAKGTYDAFGILGRFNVHKNGDDVDFKISSQKFTDLRTLINKIPMNPAIKSWIVDKVQAQSYTLNHLNGEGKITKNGFEINFDTLRGNVLFEDVKIYYKEGLDPVIADNFTLTYKERGLYFDLVNPMYKDRNMQGSKVAITHLGQKAKLLLDLHMKTAIDKTLQKVLHAYAIKIPVKQKGEIPQVDVNLTIPLGKKYQNKKVAVRVNVELGKGTVWYQKIELPLSQAHVIFDNSLKERIKVDAQLRKGIVYLGKTKFPVLSGKGTYTKNRVDLSDVHVKESWYDTKVNGTVNLHTKRANLELKVKKLTIGDKQKYVVLKDKKLPLLLEYSNAVKASVKPFGLKISNTKEGMVIALDSLKKIKPYLHNIAVDFDDGTLEVTKKKSDTYTFKGLLKRQKCFFYEKKKCYTQIPCHGTLSKKGFDFYAFHDRLHYKAKKSRMTLRNINIDLKKLLNVRSKKQSSGNKLVILGKKSTIRYDKYKLLSDSYDIELSPKGNIKATASLDGDIVNFSKKGEKFLLKAHRVKDKMLHPLIQFDGLKGGRYTLKLSGDPEKTMKGQIIVEGGIMSDFKAYNNTLAFINALPALATLSNPGFSEKGFKIIEGIAEYHVEKSNRFIFDSIYIKGESATIVGKGMIDIKQNKIDIKLAIQTARELGKFVGNLPLLGYILMGQDKSMTVGLEVTGKLSQPLVQTSATKEILTLPLELIKRTLQSPAHIINK